MNDLIEPLVELIRRTSTDLPADVEEALRKAKDREEPGSAAESALATILENVALARVNSTPICQDTGTPIFYVYHPPGTSTLKLRAQIQQAVAIATERAYLRPNAVDSLTGVNSGNNLGIDFPTIHFEEWEEGYLRIDLMLKGGGCENVGAQYKLPNGPLKAGRDLEGVKKVVLDAVHKAQGLGCAPGVIGVGIGGDRGTSYLLSKKQFFRRLDERHEDEAMAHMEEELYEKSNQLGIGPMGFGGRTTTLGVQVDYMHRLPASYFVSVSYMCWADRRRSMTVRDGEWEIV
ncbi:MAG: fumarate hydratase [Anaerolineae bacterium]